MAQAAPPMRIVAPVRPADASAGIARESVASVTAFGPLGPAESLTLLGRVKCCDRDVLMRGPFSTRRTSEFA